MLLFPHYCDVTCVYASVCIGVREWIFVYVFVSFSP